MNRQIIVAIETTGYEPHDEIIELACVEVVDGLPTGHEFHQYIRPNIIISESAIRVHGITTGALQGKPQFGDPAVVDGFLRFVGDSSVIAFQTSYVRGYVEAALAVAGRAGQGPKHWTDAQRLAENLFPDADNSIDGLAKRFGISMARGEHSGALINANIGCMIYIELADRFDWKDALSEISQADLGVQFTAAGEFITFASSEDTRDLSRSEDPSVIFLFHEVVRKVAALSPLLERFDNQAGWVGLSSATKRLQVSLGLNPEDVPRRLSQIYSLVLELGSFVEMDRSVQTDQGATVDPLPHEVRRPLIDLIRTAAPWLRLFPTIRELDDEAGAFLIDISLVEPAREVFDSSRVELLVAPEDIEALQGLVEAAHRPGLQGRKATVRSVLSARNLTVAAISLFASGMWSTFVDDSILFKKATAVFLESEPQILRLFEDASEDIKLSVSELIREIREHQR